jgi:hypothetical protein
LIHQRFNILILNRIIGSIMVKYTLITIYIFKRRFILSSNLSTRTTSMTTGFIVNTLNSTTFSSNNITMKCFVNYWLFSSKIQFPFFKWFHFSIKSSLPFKYCTCKMSGINKNYTPLILIWNWFSNLDYVFKIIWICLFNFKEMRWF